jgi:hypothetical protein
MIDDPKFDAVFEFIRRRNKVLIGHQGEPHNCWLPIAEMTVNNDKEYFREHPQYHMYLHPELPSYEEQMAARDRMLDRNPRLKFMGAHMASLEWSVDTAGGLSRPLSQHRGRFGGAHGPGAVSIQSRSRQGSRLLHSLPGSPAVWHRYSQEPGRQMPQELRREAHATWLRDWRYLNTDETFRVPELDAPVRGLGLPRDVVRKIYSSNAERWFGNPWQCRGTALGGTLVPGVKMNRWLKSCVAWVSAAALVIAAGAAVGSSTLQARANRHTRPSATGPR